MTKRTYTRRTQTQWQDYIEDQQQSGLSIKDYCQEHQLSTSNFYTWRSKLRSVPLQAPAAPPQADHDWLALPTGLSESLPATDAPAMVIRVSLPGGVSLTLTPA